MQLKNQLISFLLCCLSMAAAWPALSAGIPEILVSADRSGVNAVAKASNITVISREQIELSGARSLSELLRGKAGIFVSDIFGDGSNASIDMRGFGSTANANTLIMIDGRKLNFASDSGALALNAIELANVEQVEIIKGSAGVLFGNMAVGGVINIITKQTQQTLAELSLQVGSFGSHRQTVRLEQPLSNGWALRANLNNKQSDNYRDHNDAESLSVGVLLNKNYQSGDFFIEYDFLDDYIQTPGALFLDELAANRIQSAAVYATDYQDMTSHLLRLGLTHRFNQNWSLKMETSLTDYEREFITTFRAFPPGSLSTQDRKTLDINPRLIHQADNMQLTLGLDLQQTDYLLVSALGPQGVDQSIYSFYAQSIISVGSQVDAVVGFRHAEIENNINNNGASVPLDDDVSIGSVALIYQPTSNWQLFAKADQNFRFARVDEHTNPVFGQPVGLQNQTGITYEIGSEYKGENFQINAEVYQLVLDDEISFDSSGFSNINLDETTRQGMSLSGQLFVNDETLVGMNFDFVDSDITSGPLKGNAIPLVPEQRFRIYTEYELMADLNIMLDAIYTSEQVYGGDFNNAFQKMSSYTVFNLSGLYELDSWLISFRVNNLFDKQYSESGSIGMDSGFNNRPAEFSAPERNLWVGVKLDLSGF